MYRSALTLGQIVERAGHRGKSITADTVRAAIQSETLQPVYVRNRRYLIGDVDAWIDTLPSREVQS